MPSRPTSIADSLLNYQDTLAKRQKYIKNEFQAFGLELAQELNDWKKRAIYIRLAKTVPRPILESALMFVRDQTQGQIKSPARLFMWKLKELRQNANDQV